jgi:hypothetical protein
MATLLTPNLRIPNEINTTQPTPSIRKCNSDPVLVEKPFTHEKSRLLKPYRSSETKDFGWHQGSVTRLRRLVNLSVFRVFDGFVFLIFCLFHWLKATRRDTSLFFGIHDLRKFIEFS